MFTKLWDQTIWEEASSCNCRLYFGLNLVTLVDLTTMLSLFCCNSCLAHLRRNPSIPSFSESFAFNVNMSDSENKGASTKSHLLVILHCGNLGKSSLAVFTTVRFFPSVTSHVTLKAGGLKNCYWSWQFGYWINGWVGWRRYQDLENPHLEEAFATLVAEVGSFVVVLFPSFNKYEFL